MSTAANSQLPDEDALAAFSAGAFGGGRRRRKDKPADDSTPVAKTDSVDTPAAAEDPAVQEEPEQAPAPEPVVDTPTPIAPAAAVPPPATTPDTQPVEEAPAPKEVPEPERQTAPDTAVPQTSAQVAVRTVATAVTRTSTVPAELQGGPVDVQVPVLGPAGARATQCTIMVSHNVRERFAYYQLSKKMAGEKEPSNALVVRRAFLHAKRADLFGKILTDVYQQANAVDDEDYDEDGMMGEVIGRRAVRGRLKDTGQQSFRPSEQELANYDAYSQAYGFPSRSDFLNAVLDEFLPQLPASGRRR